MVGMAAIAGLIAAAAAAGAAASAAGLALAPGALMLLMAGLTEACLVCSQAQSDRIAPKHAHPMPRLLFHPKKVRKFMPVLLWLVDCALDSFAPRARGPRDLGLVVGEI